MPDDSVAATASRVLSRSRAIGFSQNVGKPGRGCPHQQCRVSIGRAGDHERLAELEDCIDIAGSAFGRDAANCSARSAGHVGDDERAHAGQSAQDPGVVGANATGADDAELHVSSSSVRC